MSRLIGPALATEEPLIELLVGHENGAAPDDRLVLFRLALGLSVSSRSDSDHSMQQRDRRNEPSG